MILRPTTFADAARMLSENPGVQLIAGGTDLVVRQRDGRPPPEAWIDLSAVAEGRGVTRRDQRVHVGALTCWETLAHDETVDLTLPALADAARLFGSLQVRWQGTIGGNIVNASPAGDGLPPLIAAGASARLLSARGSREVSVESLFTGPGQTTIAADEVLTEVSWPVLQNAAGGYLRLGGREHHVIAKVSAALHCRLEEGVMHDVRVALGAVAPIPLRVPMVEAAMEDLSPSDVDLRAVATAARAAASPITDVRSTAEYRADMLGELLGMLLGRL